MIKNKLVHKKNVKKTFEIENVSIEYHMLSYPIEQLNPNSIYLCMWFFFSNFVIEISMLSLLLSYVNLPTDTVRHTELPWLLNHIFAWIYFENRKFKLLFCTKKLRKSSVFEGPKQICASTEIICQIVNRPKIIFHCWII